MEVVEYWLYTTSTSLWKEKAETRKALSIYMDELKPHTENYIWHRDAFALQIEYSPELQAHYLVGKTYHGENIDDEWFIVFLLTQLTRSHPHLACRVQDCDGDILLIEAAAHLPKWLSPETATQRVYVHQGQLHIIPLPSSPAEVGVIPVGTPSLTTALGLLGPRTLAAPAIQQAVHDCLSRFPHLADMSIHRARCFLPINAAKIFQTNPQLISAVVTAFYERDPISMRACARMDSFPPGSYSSFASSPTTHPSSVSSSPSVMAEVKFTRYLYAQLISQQFTPPKVFGIPPPQNSADYKAFSIGCKLACGLEILLDIGKGQRHGELTEADLPNYNKWLSYMKRLTTAGYFRDNIEGSQEYRKLLDVARAKFIAAHNAQLRQEGEEGEEGEEDRREGTVDTESGWSFRAASVAVRKLLDRCVDLVRGAGKRKSVCLHI